MPPKRKFKHIPPIASAAPQNSSNRCPSHHEQGQQSIPSPLPVSAPSTTHSGVNTIAQSTPAHEASNGMNLMQAEYIVK